MRLGGGHAVGIGLCERVVDGFHHGGGGHGRAGNGLDIAAQRELAGLADKLRLELVLLRTRAEAGRFGEFVVANGDGGDFAVRVELDFNEHIAAKSLGRRAVFRVFRRCHAAAAHHDAQREQRCRQTAGQRSSLHFSIRSFCEKIYDSDVRRHALSP